MGTNVLQIDWGTVGPILVILFFGIGTILNAVMGRNGDEK